MKDLAKFIFALGNNSSDYVALIDSSFKIIYVNKNFEKKGLKKGKITKSNNIDISLIKKAFNENKKQQNNNQKAIPIEFSTKKYVLVIEHIANVESEKYKILTENMEDIIWTMDLKFKTTYVSPSVEKILGYTPEERKKQSLSKMVTPESKKEIINVFKEKFGKKTSKKNKELIINTEYYKKDGSTIWMENKVKWFRNKKGKIIGIYGVARDINKRIEIQKELETSKEKFYSYIENAPYGVFVADTNGKYLEVNRAACKITGYTKKELLKMSIPDLIPKEHLKDSIKHFENLLKTGRSFGENYFLTKKGEKRIWTVDAVKISNNKRIGFVRDITLEKQQQDKIKKNERLLEKVFEVLPVGLWVADENGKLERGNPKAKQIWGAEPKVSIKDYGVFKARKLPSYEDIKKPEDWALFKTVKYGKSIKDELLEIDGFDGKKRKVLNYTIPVFDENKKVEKAIVVNVDVTDIKKKEKELVESEEKFRNLFETMDQGVVYQNAKGEILSANSAAEKILGLRLDQMQGRTSFDKEWKAVDENKNDLPGEKYPAIIALKTKKKVNYFIQGIYNPKINDYVWIVVNSVPQFKKGSKEPYQVYSTFLDITNQKNAEDELKQSKEKCKFLTDNSSEVMVILDREANIIFANKFILNLLRYEEKNVVGHNISEFLTKDSFKKAMLSLKDDFEGKPGQRLEVDMITSSGEIKKILTTEQGTHIKEKREIKGILITGQDVTELRKAEKIIKENEQKFKEAQEVAHVGSWEYDIQTKKYWGSDEAKRIYGFDIEKDDFTTEEVETCISERKRVHQALIDLIEKEKEYDLVFEIHPKDKSSPKIINSKAKLIKDKNNKPLKVSGIIQDISEKEEAEKEKEKLRKEMEQRVEELERFQKLTIGRELRMVELKKKLEELEKKLRKK